MIKLLAVWRSPYFTLQITAWTSGFMFETLASNHSPRAVRFLTLLLCAVLCKLGFLVMKQLHFQLYTWAYASYLCELMSHIWWAQITPTVLRRRTQVGVPLGATFISETCWSFLISEGHNLPCLYQVNGMGMDGRQFSSLLASTKQKMINAWKMWARVWFLHCYLLRLTLALQLGSIQTTFLFLITSFVKFYSIPPVLVFQDNLNILAALQKPGFDWLAFLSSGRFAGLLF